MNDNHIGGVVVIYNPRKEYLVNFNSYIDQVNELLVFDNSSEKEDWLTEYVESNNKISYVSFQKNMGIAFALNYAARYFIDAGFEYLLTMDQDSFVPEGMIKKMLSVDCDYSRTGIISPFFINKYRTKEPGDEPYVKILFVKTSGNLLNLDIYQIVGPFDNNLFIDYVDIEFCFRVNIHGFDVIQLNSIELIHNEAALSQKKFLNKNVYPWNHQPIRWFYKIRNLFYIKTKYYRIYPHYFHDEFKNYIKQFIKILLFEDEKITKIKYAIKGYYHFKKSKMGIYIGK